MKKSKVLTYVALSLICIGWSIPMVIHGANSKLVSETAFNILFICGAITSFFSYLYFIISVGKEMNETAKKFWSDSGEGIGVFFLCGIPFLMTLIFLYSAYYYTRPHNQNIRLP